MKLPKYDRGQAKKIVSVRMYPYTIEVLDRLAAEAGQNRSDCINYLVFAGLPEKVEPRGILDKGWYGSPKKKIAEAIVKLMSGGRNTSGKAGNKVKSGRA